MRLGAELESLHAAFPLVAEGDAAGADVLDVAEPAEGGVARGLPVEALGLEQLGAHGEVEGQLVVDVAVDVAAPEAALAGPVGA